MDWRDLSVIQRLELFRERAEELRQTRFLRDTLVGGYRLKIEAKQIPGTLDEYETFFSISPYDEQDLRAFLTFFRRFFLKNDPVVNLFEIYNLCHQHLENEQYEAFLAVSRNRAAYALKASCFHLRINEQDMTPEEVSDIWINGYYFHDNIEHLHFLKTLPPSRRHCVAYLLFRLFIRYDEANFIYLQYCECGSQRRIDKIILAGIWLYDIPFMHHFKGRRKYHWKFNSLILLHEL
jgi:hypothetical protein